MVKLEGGHLLFAECLYTLDAIARRKARRTFDCVLIQVVMTYDDLQALRCKQNL